MVALFFHHIDRHSLVDDIVLRDQDSIRPARLLVGELGRGRGDISFLPSRHPRHLFDFLHEVGGLEGFVQVHGDPEFFPGRRISIGAGRVQHHDDGLGQDGLALEIIEKEEAVLAGQMGIDKDHGKRRAFFLPGPVQKNRRVLRAPCFGRAQVPRSHQPLQEAAGRHMIIHKKDGEAFKVHALGPNRLPRFVLLEAKAGRKMKPAPFSDDAFDPDLASQELDQLGGDGQAQSRPAVFSGHIAFCLDKGPEDGL